MSCQLVDINGDGHNDILAGSFSGTPQIIYGSANGYREAEPLNDANEEVVLIADFWNTEDNKWDESDRSGSEGHCTSASLVDWDDDGDLDLLLGDYYGGRLYLQLNEGTRDEPKFAGTNSPVMAGGEAIVIPKGLAAPRVVDWNDDGLFDILLGGAKGGVYCYLNKGFPDEPEFSKRLTLIEPLVDESDSFIKRVPVVDGQPTQPGSSFHVEPCDYDGDGDLDLLVGARSSWLKEKQKTLTDEEKKEVDELQEEVAQLMTKLRALIDVDDREKQQEVIESDEYKTIIAEYSKLSTELLQKNPDPSESGDFVWLFRRK